MGLSETLTEMLQGKLPAWRGFSYNFPTSSWADTVEPVVIPWNLPGLAAAMRIVGDLHTQWVNDNSTLCHACLNMRTISRVWGYIWYQFNVFLTFVSLCSCKSGTQRGVKSTGRWRRTTTMRPQHASMSMTWEPQTRCTTWQLGLMMHGGLSPVMSCSWWEINAISRRMTLPLRSPPFKHSMQSCSSR